MSRRPTPPEISWSDDSVPVASGYDDVYYSKADGLAETETVFLQGCGLPDRWQGRERFCIAELGFGTGLNALATWRLWRSHRPSPDARLRFISFEKHPIAAHDAERALRSWPELNELTAQLLAVFPPQELGYHRRWFEADGVCLTVIHGDVADTLPDLEGTVDAWFLDGFSPAKNESMWSGDVFRAIAKKSAENATLGTYTVAGHVRRGLGEVGFDVEKVPGFARKRERLIGRFTGLPSQPSPGPFLARWPSHSRSPRSALVIGTGIAGASVARALANRGVSVTVAGRSPDVADGASGNPLALLMPRLDASETATSRLLIESYLHAHSIYRKVAPDAVTEITVRQLTRTDDERNRFEKLRLDPPLGEDYLQFDWNGSSVDALHHHRALILNPIELVKSLCNHRLIEVEERQVTDLGQEAEGFDLVVIANGMSALSFRETHWLPLAGRAGQVEYTGTESDAEPEAIASSHYLLKDRGLMLFGATFDPVEGATTPETDDARSRNMAAIAGVVPELENSLDISDIRSRASVRATTPDRLPVVGLLPDRDAFLSKFDGLRQGQLVDADIPLQPKLAVLNGLGARGFTFAPLAADLIASYVFGEPLPLPKSRAGLLAPSRFLVRDLKRQRV